MSTPEPGPIRGTLADIPLADVLQVLRVTERTGVLALERAEERATLTYVAGRIASAQLHPPRHHLASYFLDRGWIDFDTLHGALRRQLDEAPHRLIGQILVETGALTAEQLGAGLELQVRAVLSEILGWSFGAFALKEVPPDLVAQLESASVRIEPEELQRLAAAARDGPDGPGEATRDPAAAEPRSVRDASWLAQPRLALIATDDLLIRHGLELRLRSAGFALVSIPGLDGIGPLLLASDDPEPTLFVDLDLSAHTRTQALRAFHRLRRLRRNWPNLRLVTFGRQVPETFYQFLLRCRIAFHVPRATVRAEGDIRIVRDFIEVLARTLGDDMTSARLSAPPLTSRSPGQLGGSRPPD